MITKDQLKAIFSPNTKYVDAYFDHLVATMLHFQINTPPRMAAFIAQVGHESCYFKYVKEIASGAAYEGRANLGNTLPGDGIRFKGRGLIQITGRANYTSVHAELGIDCVNIPEILEKPEYAAQTAGWFWNKTKLNAVADKGNFKLITKRINGGYNGLKEREVIWEKAKQVLGVAA